MTDLQRALRGDYGRRDLPATEAPMTEPPPTTVPAVRGVGRPGCEDCGAPNADTWVTVYDRVPASPWTSESATLAATMLVGRTMYLCCPCSDQRLKQEQQEVS